MSDLAAKRVLIGILAVGCLAAGLVLWLIDGGGDSQRALWTAGLLRGGILLAALWIALPSRGREAAWANVSARSVVGAVIAVVALVRLPLRIILPLFAVLALIGLVLRPRPKYRPRGGR